MPSKPKILKQRTIADTRFFQVDEVELEFTNGAQRRYEKLVNRGVGAVMVIPVLNDDILLMIREYGGGIDRYHLSFPKGAVDLGESYESAANRELQEEIGYGAHSITPLREVFLSPGHMEHNITIFLATDLYPSAIPGDEPEPLEVIEWPLEKADDLYDNEEVVEGRALLGLHLAIRKLTKQKQRTT